MWRNPRSRARRFFNSIAVLACLAGCSAHAQQLDETWMVTVNGQTVQVEPGGGFTLANVASPDDFGAGGPGTPPDFLGDDFIRVVATRTVDGITEWAFSDPFQITQGETFIIDRLTLTQTPPPFPVSIDIDVAPGELSVLTAVGETTQLTVEAILADGSNQDVTAASAWSVYRTSNPQVIDVSANGLATAQGRGTAFVTAVNEGATSVAQLTVVPDDPLTQIEGFVEFEDGTPAEGAAISVFGLPNETTSNVDGSFTLPDVASTITDSLIVRASIVVDQQQLVGSSVEVPPIPSGITDVGIIRLSEGGGALGPIILSGMDPEDHGTAGDEMIRDILNFVVLNSVLHATPSQIVMLGGSSSLGNEAASIMSPLGFTLTQFSGASIANVDLTPGTTPYDAIYMPTATADVGGGLSPADLAEINLRGADIIDFVNSGGGLAAFANNLAGGYDWFPFEGLAVVDIGDGSGIVVTPEGEFILGPSATAVEPFHLAFTGPPGFFGLDVLATEASGSMRPLIIGGVANILNGPEAFAKLVIRGVAVPNAEDTRETRR